MLDIPPFVEVSGLTLVTAENLAIARRLPGLVGRALCDTNAEVKPLGRLGQIMTVPYRADSSIRLETGLWDSKIEERAYSITTLRLAVYDQDGGAEFEAPMYHISELNLSTEAVLLYILDYYSNQYPITV